MALQTKAAWLLFALCLLSPIEGCAESSTQGTDANKTEAIRKEGTQSATMDTGEAVCIAVKYAREKQVLPEQRNYDMGATMSGTGRYWVVRFTPVPAPPDADIMVYVYPDGHGEIPMP